MLKFWLWNIIFLADSLASLVTNMTLIGNWLNISPVTLSALSQKPLQHFPPATSRFSSFALLSSTVAIPSLCSAFSKIWQGMIYHFNIAELCLRLNLSLADCSVFSIYPVVKCDFLISHFRAFYFLLCLVSIIDY